MLVRDLSVTNCFYPLVGSENPGNRVDGKSDGIATFSIKKLMDLLLAHRAVCVGGLH